MSKKIVIVSGGELEESFVLSELETLDSQFIIGVDKGMEFLYHHKILPSYIVGDFDSVEQKIGDYYRNETKVPIREFNPVKDASDTEIAIRLAMTLGASEIYILGATGGRIDHLWANVQTLTIPLGQEIYSLSIEGAKYPLHDHQLTPYDSLCVSNQFEEDEVKITFGSGIVILMETRDKK